jgi:hypothetical protein
MKTKDFKRRIVRVAMMLFALVTTTQAWAQTTMTWTFSYTGAIQSFTASKAGIYELQVWGAQGGKQGSAGGLGGYATCRTTLAQGETIYIYVGGKGGDEAKMAVPVVGMAAEKVVLVGTGTTVLAVVEAPHTSPR